MTENEIKDLIKKTLLDVAKEFEIAIESGKWSGHHMHEAYTYEIKAAFEKSAENIKVNLTDEVCND